MQKDQTTTKRLRHRGFSRSRGRAFAAVSIVGAIGLAAIATLPAGASNVHKAKPHTSAAAQLAAAEKTLQGYISAAPSGVTLSETGSSLMYPLFQEWESPASGLPSAPEKINPSSTGSGTGISEAISGAADVGASDAFLARSQLNGPPTMLNVPEVVSAQAIVYNLPSLPATTHLKLTPVIMNDIYNGAISNWDNKLIAKANPGVTLPNQKIIPIRRSDGSGDTFIFTSYLWYGDKTSWNHASPYFGPSTAYALWPSVSGELAEKGNPNMVSGANANVGSVAYVGVSFLSTVNADHLGVAKLQNGNGNYELPDLATITAEISSFHHFPPTGAINLVFSKVQSARFGYPIVNFEYAIVQKNQSSSTKLAAVKALLAWGMDPKYGAQSGFLGPINFKQMPTNGIQGAITLLKSMTSS